MKIKQGSITNVNLGYKAEVLMEQISTTEGVFKQERVKRSSSNIEILNQYGKELFYAVKEDDLDKIKDLIINRSADFNVKNNYGSTLLHVASYNGHLRIVKYLVEEKNADFNVKDNNGRTSLHWAAKNGNLNIVKYLIDEKKIDVNIRDKKCNTPLHLAAESGNLSIITYLVGEKNADLHIKNKYGQRPIYLAAKNNHLATVKYLKEGIVPVLEGIDAIVGIAGGVIDILQKFGVLPNEESKNFEKVFDALGKNYAAIEEVGDKVDRNFAAMKAVYEIARQTLFDIEETTYEMRLGFQRVLDSISELRVDDKVSKITTFMSDFFTNDIHIINKLSREERSAKLKELSKVITTSGGVLHDNLNDIIEQGLAIPNPNSAGDSTENNVRFAAFHTVYYGTQVCVSVVFFVIEQYSYLAGDYYHTGEIEKYNELYGSLQAEFDAFKGSLSNNGSIIDKVSAILTTVQNLPLVRNGRKDIFELLPDRIASLRQVKDKLEHMMLPLIIEKPSKVMGIPDFSKSNVATPIGQWKDGVKVSYAVQYRYNSTYSQVGEWSDSVAIHGKANPFLTIPAAGDDERERLIFRKFDNGKAELVGVMKEKDENSFRDISRDVYDAALSSDKDRARDEIKILLSNGADINEIFDNGRKAIHAAAQSNNFNITLDLLRLNETDINEQDTNGYTPIYIAAEAGYVDFVKSLIDHGADPNIKTNVSNLTLTPLHIAAYKGYFSVVEILMLSNKTDINVKDKDDFTPLHSATFSDSSPTVCALLNSNNTDVNAKSKEGLTPLHLTAIKKRHADAAKVLLESYKADVNAEAKGNLTALHFAASIGNLKVAQVLIGDNATNINVKSADNLTPLHFATSLKKEDVALELLKAQDIEVNIKGKGDITPLHIATVTGQKNVTLSLLEKGALTEEKTKDGLTALHLAAVHNKYEIIPILVDNGAIIEAKTVNGSTPLHLASFAGNKNATSILLDKGADTKAYDGNGQMPVHVAVLNGETEIVRLFIARDPSLINLNNQNSESLLHLAVQKDYLDIVRYLVDEKDVYVNVRNRDHDTPLHYAAKYGYLDVIKYFVDNKGIDTFTNNGGYLLENKISDTPLDFAARSGQLEIVKYFIDDKKIGNIDIYAYHQLLLFAAESGNLDLVRYFVDEKNAILYEDDTVLAAARYGRLNVVQYFIDEKNTDVNRKFSTNDLTILHYAALSGSLGLVKYLVDEKNSDINVMGHCFGYEKVPLHYAALSGNLDLVKYFVDEKKIDVNVSNSYFKEMPIHFAALSGNLDLVKYLVDEKKVDVNSGVTPPFTLPIFTLHFAVLSGSLGLVKYLVEEKGASIDVKSFMDNKPLDLAFSSGNLDLVKYFLDEKNVSMNGGCIFIPKKRGQYGDGHVEDLYGIYLYPYEHMKSENYLNCAAANGNLEIIKYLVDEKKVDVNAIENDKKLYRKPLHCAVQYGYLDIVKYLINHTADVNVKDYEKDTPLDYAAKFGYMDIVRYLVDEEKVDTNVDTNKDSCGETPLHLAASGGYLDIVKYLVEKGVDFNVKTDGTGETPLHLAAHLGKLSIVKYLIGEKRADFNIKNNFGMTPLHLAAENGKLDVVKYLIEKRAYVNVKDNYGQTPLHSAVGFFCDSENLETVKYLIKKGAYVNAIDKYGCTCLNYCSAPISSDSIKKYLESQGGKCHTCKHPGTQNLKNYRYHNTQNNAIVESRASRQSSWINICAHTIIDVAKGISQFIYSPFKPAIKMKHSQSSQSSIAVQSVDVNGALLLLDVFVRKITGERYVSSAEQSISTLEARGYALNITSAFEKIVRQAAEDSKISLHRLNIDFIGMQEEVTEKIMIGKLNKISGILSSYMEKTCPGREAGCPGKLSSKKFDKFMATLNNKLDIALDQSIPQILYNEHNTLEVNSIKEQQRNLENEKPRSYLDNISAQGYLTQGKYLE